MHFLTVSCRALRLAGLLALPFAEVLAVTLLYDTGALRRQTSGFTAWMEHAWLLPRWGIATLGAFAVISLSQGWRLPREMGLAAQRHPTWPRWLLAHGLALGAFCALTDRVFHGGVNSTGLVLSWLMAAGLTAALYLAAVLPADFWRGFLAREGKSLALSVAVGAIAVWFGFEAQSGWLQLSEWTFAGVRTGLEWLSDDVVCEPAQRVIGTAGFRVQIAPECSGYEGLGLIGVFLTLFLVASRRALRFPHALVVLPIGLAVIWGLNIARIVALIILGDRWSPEVAVQGFHSQAGWLLFCGTALALAYGTLRSPWLTKQTLSTAAPRSATTAYLLPLMALLACQMLTGAFTADFDVLYPVRVLVVAWTLAALWRWPRRIAWSWLSVANGLVVFVLWMALEPSATETESVLATRLQELGPVWSSLWIAFRVIGSCVTVPIVEELAFRGFFLRRLAAVRFEEVDPRHVGWIPMLVSSLAFGLLHGRMLAGTLAGVCYALEYRRRGELSDAVAAHATTNALIAATVLLASRWSLWE
jgi:exosortase E/protease (VPEID-CTERM system)